MLIFESPDGRDTAWTRQNADNVLNAVKNSGDARRTITGGTNLPESTSCAEVTVVFSNLSWLSVAHGCARDGWGAEQQSSSPKLEPYNAVEIRAARRTPILLNELRVIR